MGFGRVESKPPDSNDEDYRRGYLCGVIRGDGHLGYYPYVRAGRKNGDQYRFRLAMSDREALTRAAEYLRGFGVETGEFLFSPATARRLEMRAIRASSRAAYERIGGLISWPEKAEPAWSKGYLAGLFDAEGSFSDGILRIANTDEEILSRAGDALSALDFDFVQEHAAPRPGKPMHYLRVRGGLAEHIRFFRLVSPAIARKRDITGQALKSQARLGVRSIEELPGERDLWDISTGTGDFIASGVVSHNCYARPYHEYLGLSSGLDFETMIFAKEDAPELLAAELAKKSWVPDWIALGGVTDCYQPVERTLKITRRCLETLADARNPCGLVTKNALVTRDADVFQELARWRAVRVFVTLTTLDPDLARRLEPRASAPAARLAAIEALSKAGVPVGVMTAPMILGLNDHELPKLLDAAAGAGARHAAYIPLRLPHELGTLFTDWLERNYPDRKAKVLSQIRAIRGGRLNDPDFGSRMRGTGVFAEHLAALFAVTVRRLGLNAERLPADTSHFRRPLGGQLRLL